MSSKKPSSKGSKKNNEKQVALQIYARVRCLMPWEPEKVSLKIEGQNKIRNRSGTVTNEYSFSKVFNPKQDNQLCFNIIVMPMISNVLKGFNAVLIAYGQTGSGKTFSMLGKPKLGIVGLLPMMLEYLVQQSGVKSVSLSAVEAFGHHIAKIRLFDLFSSLNETRDWSAKKGDTSLDVKKAHSMNILNALDAHSKIISAHSASHFAPTGKNPESSRGHVTFVAKIIQIMEHIQQISYFVMVDCAGSEGESAFTKEYIASVDKQTLMARRLEAGCINTGLSQLQIIFNELRLKGKLSKAIGNGLRRVLHPYINTKTYLSVLFCLSPSINNSRSTEATLKFAVTAGMVKVSPIASKKVIDFETLISELKQHIETQEIIIEENNDKMENIQTELNAIKLDIIDVHEEEERKKEEELLKEKNKNDKDKNDFMKEIMRQKTNESNQSLSSFNIQVYESDEENDDNLLSPKSAVSITSPLNKRKKHRTLTLSSSKVISLDIEPHERIQSEVPAVVQIQLAALEKQQEDEAAALYNPITDEYGDIIDPVERVKIAAEKKDAPKIIDQEENEREMKEAIHQHQTLNGTGMNVTEMAKKWNMGTYETKNDEYKTKNNDDDDIKQEEEEEEEENDNNNDNINVYDDVYGGGREDEYNRLKAIDYRKLEKEELDEYADEVLLFYQQEIVIKKNLQQSTNVITDYLQEEFEGLLSFFRIRKILPKQRIDIQW